MTEQIGPVEQLTNCGSGDQVEHRKDGEGQHGSLFAFNPKASEFIPGTGANSGGDTQSAVTTTETLEESLTPTSTDGGEVDFQETPGPGVNPLEFAEDDSEMMAVFESCVNNNVPKLPHPHHHPNPDWIGGSGDSMFTPHNQMYGGPPLEPGSEAGAVLELSTVNNAYAGYNYYNNGLLPLPLPNGPFPEQVQLTPIYQLIAYAQQPCPSIPAAAPALVQVPVMTPISQAPAMNPIAQVPQNNPGFSLTSTGRQMMSQQAFQVPVPVSQENYRTPRAPYHRQRMNLETLPLLVVRPRLPQQQQQPYLPQQQQRFPVRMPSEQHGFHPVPPPHLPQPSSAQSAFAPTAPTRGPSPFVTVYIPNVDVNGAGCGGSGDQSGSRSIPSLIPVILPRPT